MFVDRTLETSRLGALCALATALSLACPRTAAGIVIMSHPPAETLRLMTVRAEFVLVGDVVGARGVVLPDSTGTRSRDELVWTENQVRVREVWKGTTAPGETLTVWTRGGAVPGGLGYWVEDEAELRLGGRYVLFMGPWEGRREVYDGEAGALRSERGHVNGYITRGSRTEHWLRSRVHEALDAASQRNAGHH